jgi:hypothetical protein
MMSVYGVEGYGWYWIIVEMMREQADFTLSKEGKYSLDAIAMQMYCNKDTAEKFVSDCIEEFELFKTDGNHFWSDSLLRRMAIKEELSQKRKKAAKARWSKMQDGSKEDAEGMQMYNKSNAFGMQGKEKKGNEIKETYLEFVKLTKEEHSKLIEKLGLQKTNDFIHRLNDYIGSKGKKYRSHYHTILSWERKDMPTDAHQHHNNMPRVNTDHLVKMRMARGEVV